MLSVVIPSHRRADLLRLCLTSVAAHRPSDAEVVVVDDASPGGSVSSAAADFTFVKVLRLPKQSGFCVAANTGIRAATGEVVQLLNDDTEVTPGWAEAAVRHFADPRVVGVAPLVLQSDLERQAVGLPPIIDSAGDEYDPGGFASKRCHGRVADSLRESGSDADSRRESATLRLGVVSRLTVGPVWGLSATAGFYRRSALLAAGLFPEHFGAYFEDVDLSHRLRRFGEVWFEPGSVVWHRVSSSYGRRPGNRVLEQQSCNEERVFWRNVRGRELWRHLPRHVVVVAGKAIRRLKERRFVPWAVGRLRAWCGG